MPKILFHAFSKNENQEVRFSAGDYKAKMYVDMRVYFKNAESEERLPTKRGLTLPVELVPELRKGLDKMEEALKNIAPTESPA